MMNSFPKINKNTVQKELATILNTIFANVNVPMGKYILSKTHDSTVQFKNNKYNVIINVAPLFTHKKESTIPEQDFVDMVWSCFHEEEHLRQNDMFRTLECNHEIRHMAHTELLHIAIPETYANGYLSGYWHNINEINAELYGLQKTRVYFQENYPEIDVDNHIVNLIKDKTIWYADNRNITNIHEAIQKLEEAKQQSYTKPILLPIRYIQNNYSPCLKAFVSDETRKIAYVNAYDNHDGQTCMNLLLDFIKENQPWKYKKFPCLQDEWTDKIRNAEPPTFAKLRNLDRTAGLEEYEDKFNSEQEKPTDDFGLSI